MQNKLKKQRKMIKKHTENRRKSMNKHAEKPL